MMGRCRIAGLALVVTAVWWPGVCVAQEAVRDAVPVAGGSAGGVFAAGEGNPEGPASVTRRRVLDELEALEGEIAMLKVLRDAQLALIGWNRLLLRSGDEPVGLDTALCRRVGAWCAALPASFGRQRERNSG